MNNKNLDNRRGVYLFLYYLLFKYAHWNEEFNWYFIDECFEVQQRWRVTSKFLPTDHIQVGNLCARTDSGFGKPSIAQSIDLGRPTSPFKHFFFHLAAAFNSLRLYPLGTFVNCFPISEFLSHRKKKLFFRSFQ